MCERYQYQRTDRDIKDAMRRRKQGANENFDYFLDATLFKAVLLTEPLGESEMITEVGHNLEL